MKTDIINRLETLISEDCKPIDREERFRDLLRECYSFDSVGGPFAGMCPARVIEEIDPGAFRCGVNDYEDSEDWREVGGEYYTNDDCDEKREELISDLETEIEELETEIEEETEHNSGDGSLEIDALQRKITDLRADITTLKQHVF